MDACIWSKNAAVAKGITVNPKLQAVGVVLSVARRLLTNTLDLLERAEEHLQALEEEKKSPVANSRPEDRFEQTS